jgi:hypothetical protein
VEGVLQQQENIARALALGPELVTALAETDWEELLRGFIPSCTCAYNGISASLRPGPFREVAGQRVSRERT